MAFTPKQVRKIEEQIKANAARIVDEFIAALDGGEPVDFMDAVAKEAADADRVSEMIGLPKDQHETVAAAAEPYSVRVTTRWAATCGEGRLPDDATRVLTTAGVELARTGASIHCRTT